MINLVISDEFSEKIFLPEYFLSKLQDNTGKKYIILYQRSGTLTSVLASPDGFKESGWLEIPERSTVPSMDKRVWTHPVVANGKLYVRDHDLLFCFDPKK